MGAENLRCVVVVSRLWVRQIVNFAVRRRFFFRREQEYTRLAHDVTCSRNVMFESCLLTHKYLLWLRTAVRCAAAAKEIGGVS